VLSSNSFEVARFYFLELKLVSIFKSPVCTTSYILSNNLGEVLLLIIVVVVVVSYTGVTELLTAPVAVIPMPYTHIDSNYLRR